VLPSAFREESYFKMLSTKIFRIVKGLGGGTQLPPSALNQSRRILAIKGTSRAAVEVEGMSDFISMKSIPTTTALAKIVRDFLVLPAPSLGGFRFCQRIQIADPLYDFGFSGLPSSAADVPQSVSGGQHTSPVEKSRSCETCF
jgi:hypothetical protein